jgi:hypothetical protein
MKVPVVVYVLSLHVIDDRILQSLLVCGDPSNTQACYATVWLLTTILKLFKAPTMA